MNSSNDLASVVRLIQQIGTNTQADDDTDPNNIVMQLFLAPLDSLTLVEKNITQKWIPPSPLDSSDYTEKVDVLRWGNSPVWAGNNIYYAKKESTQLDFQQGTISGVIASTSGDGDLELQTVVAPTFTRSSVAYKSDGTQVSTNIPRFETGKFGQAVMIEEGTTNLLTTNQSSVETDLTGLYASSGATLSRDTTTYRTGSASAKLISSVSGTVYIDIWGQRVPGAAGLPYTFSVWLKTQANSNAIVRLGILFIDSSGAVINTSYSDLFPAPKVWTRYTLTATAPAGTATIDVAAYLGNAVANDILWWDDAQLEQKPYATSFVVGTRSPEALTIPAVGVLNPNNFTIEGWFYIPYSNKSVYGISINNGTSIGRFDFFVTSNGTIRWEYYDGTTVYGFNSTNAITWNAFNSVVWRFDGTSQAIFVNGVKTTGSLVLPSVATLTKIAIGTDYDLTSNIGNWLHDDLRISSIARSDADILAVYQSNAPLPVDQYTTAKLNFDGTLTIMRDGYRISPIYNISQVGQAASSFITWNANTPANTGITIQTNLSLDGGTTWQGWQSVSNGGTIPGITSGTDLSNARLQIQQILATNDSTITPQLYDVTVSINLQLNSVPITFHWNQGGFYS